MSRSQRPTYAAALGVWLLLRRQHFRWVRMIDLIKDGMNPYGAIDYLTAFGYSPEQAYLLLGAAPIEGRLSGVVDIPNACATVYLPTAIFDFDVRPGSGGPTQINPGQGAPHSAF